MVKLPNWKDLKNKLEDPQQREELRDNLQRGVERGRDNAAKRLAGPAAHLRNVGSQFKAGINQSDTTPPGQAPSSPSSPTVNPASEPDESSEPPTS